MAKDFFKPLTNEDLTELSLAFSFSRPSIRLSNGLNEEVNKRIKKGTLDREIYLRQLNKRLNR